MHNKMYKAGWSSDIQIHVHVVSGQKIALCKYGYICITSIHNSTCLLEKYVAGCQQRFLLLTTGCQQHFSLSADLAYYLLDYVMLVVFRRAASNQISIS